jgi:hypothetical protein
MESPEIALQPAAREWGALLRWATHAQPHAAFLGKSAHEWREVTRRELGLSADRPVIATGHEAVLWHPGILAKYIALDAWTQFCGAARVHLVVDQHVGGFGAIDVPVCGADGSLNVETISLGTVQPDVPMGWHPPLEPDVRLRSDAALPSVRDGLERILELIRAHREAPNAAAQMGRVLDALLKPWVSALPGVTASALMTTSLARAMVRAMIDAPRTVAEHYNSAVARVPEAGIAPLLISPSEVELPVWRIDEQGRRQRAFDRDVRTWLDDPTKFALPPRALTMTTLLRLGVCDVFIHGFGGARYDPAMEKWIESWLGAAPQPTVMVSATLRLTLASPDEARLDERNEQHRLRHLWHDPAASEPSKSSGDSKSQISNLKLQMLNAIDAAPRNSIERRNLFLEMHERLAALRRERDDELAAARARLERARQQQRERDIVERRTWPFPFYPAAMIEELARTITQGVREGCESEHAKPHAAGATSARS